MSITSNISIISRKNCNNGHYKINGRKISLTVNPQVVGSSPTRGAKKNTTQMGGVLFGFHWRICANDLQVSCLSLTN